MNVDEILRLADKRIRQEDQMERERKRSICKVFVMTGRPCPKVGTTPVTIKLPNYHGVILVCEKHAEEVGMIEEERDTRWDVEDAKWMISQIKGRK